MNIIKQDNSYLAADTRNTNLEGNYQLLELTVEYPKGRTIGVYKTKKEVITEFNNVRSSK